MLLKIKPTATRLNLLLIALLAGASAIFVKLATSTQLQLWDGNPDINGICRQLAPRTLGPFRTMWKQAQVYPKWVLSVRFSGQGSVVGGEIPYQDWAPKRSRDQQADPQLIQKLKRYLPSPAATYLPYPFQILQGTDKIMIVYGFSQARTIPI